MNTVLCDALTSDPADVLGPVILWWLQGQQDVADERWEDYVYADRSLRHPEPRMYATYCLSEVLDPWLANRFYDVGTLLHEDCRWQR